MDNSNLGAKTKLRQYFLNKIPDDINVLECFAGEKRELYHACYANQKVTSLDMKTVEGTLTIDNRKFIAGSDLTKYNFFDLDAYGSPYELMLNIMKKKTGQYVIILTDGLARNLNYGSGSKLIQTIINNKAEITIPTLNKHHKFIVKLLIKKISDTYQTEIIDAKIILEDHNNMIYLGLLCKSTDSRPNKA